MRGEDFGGAPEGTPELYFEDPDGIMIQLQDASYCGGGGVRGDRCLITPESAPTGGLLTVRDYNHFSIFVSDTARSLAFYDAVFGLPRTDRGVVSSLRLGSGQFLGIAAVGQSPTIHHACLNVDDFDPDRILSVLEDYGLTPRGDTQAPVGPLTYYVITRREDNGGAPGGTPEVYFADPDGILIQLQDARYCGGAGYWGEVC
jgi:catechol 2,3-dioxygenase-like lactoylglutathione lyase family enzyme